MKDILVPLDTTDLCELRIDAAITLAEKFDSHITGLYAKRTIDQVFYGEAYTEMVIAAMTEYREKETADVTKLFNDRLKLRYAKSDLKIEKFQEDRSFGTHANLADLIVTAQHDSTTQISNKNNQPEHLVMSSGRPVLVVPYIGFPKTMGDHVMVAWDKSREATRAVHDALPILKKAKSVSVFSVTDRRTGEQEAVGADLAEHLARHDVNVETKPVVSENLSVADYMLSSASDLDIDMIVMGAYGHSRLREYTFGGTTRSILKSMTVPVFMAH